YGDACLAVSDHVLMMTNMNRILAADWQSGRIVAEAGLTLAELIEVALPRGWFPPVTPGTKFITLGGAVANDVHGKNHHVMGTFGRHVGSLTLYRTDTGASTISRTQAPELFAATIAGLGLTGVILSVELQLRPVSSARIQERRIRFRGLDEFFDLVAGYDQDYEYTVAWIDCAASGKTAGRGHLIVGNHAPHGALRCEQPGALKVPIDPPFSLVNPFTLRAFNAVYYRSQLRREVQRSAGYDSFFYPLDRISGWNRMYGRAGFQQYQCIVPDATSRESIRSVVRAIARSGTGSFLAVLKKCGALTSPGLLSFPMPGVSLALDFPQSARTVALFGELDALVHDAGGRLYPAKDAHMTAGHFQSAYPAWRSVEALRDPRLMSRFWQRVTQ
ncbi:MAG TPA: FAD-binding oxidoreductase, partial [Steroidobacteraceae bacterium]|nr:FAD-binding oxidoreductase [Steroidobacteraceae bacterium]